MGPCILLATFALLAFQVVTVLRFGDVFLQAEGNLGEGGFMLDQPQDQNAEGILFHAGVFGARFGKRGSSQLDVKDKKGRLVGVVT